jgi:hypothetical protein
MNRNRSRVWVSGLVFRTLPAPDNGSVARAQTLSRPTEGRRNAGTRLDRVCSTRATISAIPGRQ